MDNAIIKEEELLNLKAEINLVKAHLKVPQNIVVLDMSPLEFLNFCKSNNISTVFYEYQMYYEKEYYLITEEILKANTNNAGEYNFCKKWVDEHNSFVESFDFTEPRRLVMVACFDSIIISYIKINN